MTLLRVVKILLAFILFCSSVKGQIDYITSYYPLIYMAESAIVEDDLLKALNTYQAAFQSVDKVFAIDVVNASVCAIKVDSTAIAYELQNRLISKGISKSYLNEFKGFEWLRGSKQWMDLMANYDSIRSLIQFNDRLANQLDSLTEVDQKFRIALGSYSKYGDTIAKIDHSNVKFFRDLIQKYGFPNEHLLGAEYPEISFPGEIILHHYCQSISLNESESKYNFDSDFFYAIQNGELDPHRMAQLIGMQGKYAPDIGQNTVIQISLNGSKSEVLREKVSQERLSTIDENRVITGLESQNEYFYKATFALFDPRAKDFEFKRYTQTEIYECNEETYNRLLSVFETIKQ